MAAMSDDERDMYSDAEDEYDDMGEAGAEGDGTNRRAHHNALERKRRDCIKDQFTLLKEVIPELQGTKASRADILKRSTDHINELNRGISQKERAVKWYADKIEQLQAEINHVKRKQERRAARGTAHYDTSSSSDSCDSTDTELEPVTAQRKRHRAEPTGF